MTTKTKKQNVRSLVILLMLFIIPVLLAKLALEQNWFNKGATNKGQLLEPALDFSVLNDTESNKWRLAYALPAVCEQTCENTLYSLNQIWLALGKEQERVTPLILWTADSDAEKLARLSDEGNFALLMVNQENVNKVFKDTATDGIFLIDTLDNVILKYPLQTEKQQAVLKSRDILTDLKKLLKLSRIG